MRRLLHNGLAVFLVIASVLLLVGSVLTIWLYGTALNTDRFVGTVSAATSDPVVLEATSERLSTQIVEGLDLETRLREFLPDALDRLAAPLVEAVQSRMAEALETVLTGEGAQNVWNTVLRGLHSQLLSFLRNQTPSTEIEDGVLTVDLLVIIGNALKQLQADGVIGPEVVIPDMTVDENRQAFIDRLDAALERDVPDNLGIVQVANVRGLQAASSVVQTADVLVYALPILALVVTLFALWFADRRRRAVVWIVVGVEIALILAWLAASTLTKSAAESVAARDGPTLAIAIAGEVSESLGGWLGAWIVAFALIGAIAYLLVRPRQHAEDA